jgi:hypothetical protein
MSSFLQDADSSRTPSVIAESAAASRTSTHNKSKKILEQKAHVDKYYENFKRELQKNLLDLTN